MLAVSPHHERKSLIRKAEQIQKLFREVAVLYSRSPTQKKRYLGSKYGMVVMQVHLFQHLRDIFSLEISCLCPLCKATFVARGSKHPSPPTNSCIPEAPLTARGEDEILRYDTAHPSRPLPRQRVRVQTIQLNPTGCILRPYLGEAKYTLSHRRQWMADWNSSFFG